MGLVMNDTKKWCGCPRGQRRGHRNGGAARLFAAADRLGVDVALDVRALCEAGDRRLYRLKDGTIQMARDCGRKVER